MRGVEDGVVLEHGEVAGMGVGDDGRDEVRIVVAAG